ncbi:MAG TPA: VCBS repeat-containing protein, partial [Gemmatimonadaceae bacterium]
QKEYRVEDRPDLGGVIRSQRADPDFFLVNDGKGHFTRTPISGARFVDENGKPLAQDPDYFTLAARFYDVNGDGAPDLYVCNDFEDPDQFWINDGKGNFRLLPGTSMRESSNTCMSVDFGDVNRDGHVDFFTADMMSRTLEERQQQFPTNSPMPKPIGLANDRQQWMSNMLQLARGDATWANIASFAGLEASDWTWGSAFVDVDLDGYEDLLVVNGHRWDIRNADVVERIKSAMPPVPYNREQGEFPRLDAHSVAFHNNHDLTFADASKAWGFGTDAAISQGIALADLDGDGDMDVIVTRLDGTPVVYRNESTAPRIAVRLRGLPPNTSGIGAKVTVRATSVPAQSREMTAGGYYLSGSEAQLAFATGKDSVVTIDVRWRSGKTTTITDAHPGRLYEIDEAGAAPPAANASLAATPADSLARALFEDATPLLGGHQHVDSAFDDFRRQPLLPNRFSQLGPGVSWIDVDGDGREDLVVGTGRGGRLTVLRNGGGRFAAAPTPGAAAKWDLTTILPVPDARGATMLMAGQSSYEASSADEALSVPSGVGVSLSGGRPSAMAPVLPPDTASVGPLALADVNGDGRLDLFVGARVKPGVWPLPARSHLYLRAADGTWTPDTANDQVLAKLGLVSSAMFADLDGDGWPELVVTSEFGPVRVLHNEHGRFRDVTKALGLAGQTSRWNGVVAGDFDGDGRLDLVATSWGRNTAWQASSDRPYELVLGNFGNALGLVFARRDSVSGREMPLESYNQLSVAVPSLRDRFPTYASFARADVDSVLGSARASAARIGATTFDHMLWLNRGDHFEPHPLPGIAQLAPAFAPVIGDFDGDGHEDLFLAQNFSPTAMNTSRFDAGEGLLLLGDGRGGFRPMSVLQSGIRVLGDQRGAAAADYDGDGRLDLAVSQNGAATTLWHNRGGRPGLRVRLVGPPANPLAIGAELRVVTPRGSGPVREIRAGSGYWSMDAATTVLALPADATALRVRWPGGRAQTVPLAANQREVKVTAQ